MEDVMTGPCPGCNDTGICGEEEFADYCSCVAGISLERRDAKLVAMATERLLDPPAVVPAKATLRKGKGRKVNRVG